LDEESLVKCMEACTTATISKGLVGAYVVSSSPSANYIRDAFNVPNTDGPIVTTLLDTGFWKCAAGKSGFSALITCVTQGFSFAILYLNGNWANRKAMPHFWDDLIIGVLTNMGLGGLVGGSVSLLGVVVDKLAGAAFSKILEGISLATLQTALKAIPVMAVVSFLLSAMWNFCYDYLYKQRITGEQLLKLIFFNLVNAILESILASGSLLCGPAAIPVFIIGSILINVLLSKCFMDTIYNNERRAVFALLGDEGRKIEEQEKLFECPISLQIMKDPAVLNGIWFEKELIVLHVQRTGDHPITRDQVTLADIQDDPEMKEFCRKFQPLCERRQKELQMLVQ